MTHGEKASAVFAAWYESRRKVQGGFPARGTIGGALVVLDRLKQDFNLNIDTHTTRGTSQIQGLSGEQVKRLLARFGEDRPFLREGGRTNRGVRGDMKDMLEAIEAAELDELSDDERNAILRHLQRFLVDKVRDWHNRQRLQISYDSSKSTRQSIHELLVKAEETGKKGAVAQYLVGAKLQLRFPNQRVGNESYSTADEQLGRPGDFLVGDTAFHVTVAPVPSVYEKCARNIEDGLRPFLLVPDELVVGTRQNAEMAVPGRIAVESIESFVGQNLEELSTFAKDGLADGFRRLLETYNDRVDAVESDKSLLIEIPRNLRL